MKILMLAWRDLNHPAKGGAEVVTDIYLKGLSELGHDVTLFTSRYPNSQRSDIINGYKVIRKGNTLTVSLHGLLYAKLRENDFDFIIEQINTLPFLTPLLIKQHKRILFSHQLCRNIWPYEMPFPLSYIGYALESIYLRLYGTTRAITVSNSSRDDLIKYAHIDPRNILVLENQIDFQPVQAPMEKNTHLVFCGRLTPSKRPDHAIKALHLLIKRSNPQSISSATTHLRLIVIGTGHPKYQERLFSLVRELGITDRVVFAGSISSQERNKIMQTALALIVTSVREGWGLVVTEANANGTIAVTYNVEGLRDANNNDIGLITETASHNTPEEVAKLLDIIITNPDLRIAREVQALTFATAHSNWSMQIRRLEQWLELNR